MEGVDNVKNGNQYPYKNLGYLFLNSLPISTLREKTLSAELTDTIISEKQNSYMSSIFNKVSAIHKLPYAFILKYGSIWHRYKTYIENGTDMLDSVWKNFDYDVAYDPTTSASTTTYQITDYQGSAYTYSLNYNNMGSVGVNVGMYPKVINSLYYMFNDEDIITGYTSSDWTSAYDNGLRIGKTNQSSINLGLGSMLGDPLNSVSIKNWYSFINITQTSINSELIPRILVVPSTGGLKFNQYKFENQNPLLTNFEKTSTQIQSDETLYDGSVRTLWNSSNFGYFNHSLTNLFTISDVTLTGNEDKDGPLIADKQLSSFAFGIDNFLSYQVVFKRGNPSNFNRRVWNSFSTNQTVKPLDPVDFGKYVTGSLPTSGGTTLSVSKSQNADAWEQLYLNVGEYKLNSLAYKDSGSYITDFFIDFNIEFTAENVVVLAPLIKMYATQKVENGPSYSSTSFLTSFNTYLSDLNKYQSNILNHVFRYLNQNLPNITEVKNQRVSALDGEVAKVEIWETFKAMNDKWIAGGDFKNRSLFEDFMFLDRANRDIGNKLIVDVTTLTGYLSSTNDKLSVYSLISELLSKNNFLFMALPAYVNFYGVQETGKGGTPVNVDIPNSAFGTYLILE